MKKLRVYFQHGDAIDFHNVRRFVAGKTGIACWYFDGPESAWGQVFFSHAKIAGFTLTNTEAEEPKEIKSYGPLRSVADVDAATPGASGV